MLWRRPLTMLRLLALLSLCEVGRTGFLVSALPLGGAALGLSPGMIGALAGAHYLADALAKGPAGLLTARWGLGRSMWPAPALGLLCLLLAHRAPHPAALLAAGIAWGLSYAALWPAVMSASQALAQPRRTARALTVTDLSVAPAILLGALGVGPLLRAHPDAAWAILIGAQVLALLLALSAWSLKLGSAPAVSAPVWRDWRRVGALLPGAFAQTLAPGLLTTVMYPLLDRLHLGLRDLLLPGALAAAVFGLSAWQMGRRADRHHPRAALLPGLLLLSVTFGLCALPGAPDRLPLLGALLGLGYGAFITGWHGLVARTLPGGQQAAGWGTVMAAEALGYAAGPALGGAAWQLGGVTGVFGLGAAVLLITFLYSAARGEPQAAPPPATDSGRSLP